MVAKLQMVARLSQRNQSVRDDSYRRRHLVHPVYNAG